MQWENLFVKDCNEFSVKGQYYLELLNDSISGTTSARYEYRETGNKQAIHLSPSHLIPLNNKSLNMISHSLTCTLYLHLDQSQPCFCIEM